MKYMGSKSRIAKHILPIILENRTEEQFYVEPFVGGANMIDKVSGNRIGGEFNSYIAEMWIQITKGWLPKSNYSREDYSNIKSNKDINPAESGYVGIAVSYCGKWFGGYAGLCNTKSSGIVDYQKQAFNNLINQIPKIKDVKFVNSDYRYLEIPNKSIIYCDPPYEGTTGYKNKFNHIEFWEWCRIKKSEGHTIFVSEYNAPEDFICVWSGELSSSLSSNGKSGGSKKSVEKLFTLKNEFNEDLNF